MAFSNEWLDQLLAGCERPEDILGPQGLFAQLKKALAERAQRIKADKARGLLIAGGLLAGFFYWASKSE